MAVCFHIICTMICLYGCLCAPKVINIFVNIYSKLKKANTWLNKNNVYVQCVRTHTTAYKQRLGDTFKTHQKLSECNEIHMWILRFLCIYFYIQYEMHILYYYIKQYTCLTTTNEFNYVFFASLECLLQTKKLFLFLLLFYYITTLVRRVYAIRSMLSDDKITN